MDTVRSVMLLRYAFSVMTSTPAKHSTTMRNIAWNAVSTDEASARTFATGTMLHTDQLPRPTGATHT